ncbi:MULTISPECIES: OsmC family protein [Aliiglaciecola]|uniref:OsmC family protein n=1 Tax=Aliiglaciecola TaxID=1406885 RepID=UPI001C086B1F|nr:MULTISPECIES: OsmC family protein [Aliiglaciecola]MBU2880134.1 OsmC family protein [Aliiglaciecola lipolytica]MDO6710870.1 OsmC family protein [Aliiglaciecola sp. 2_MG-2023]MDO6752351.1 OsmC family protein [Aliiglaciecola sp. 1_MG-2023]
MAIVKWATAKYDGLGKDGKGHVSMQSGALQDHPYGFNTRFEDRAGTNPEEQIAAAHASCFTMALSMGLSEQGYKKGRLETKAAITLVKDDDGFSVTKSEITLDAQVPGMSGADFEKAAVEAKLNCPISKLLACDVTLDITSFQGN